MNNDFVQAVCAIITVVVTVPASIIAAWKLIKRDRDREDEVSALVKISKLNALRIEPYFITDGFEKNGHNLYSIKFRNVGGIARNVLVQSYDGVTIISNSVSEGSDLDFDKIVEVSFSITDTLISQLFQCVIIHYDNIQDKRFVVICSFDYRMDEENIFISIRSENP